MVCMVIVAVSIWAKGVPVFYAGCGVGPSTNLFEDCLLDFWEGS